MPRQPNGETVLTTTYGRYVWDATLELLEYHIKDKPTPDQDWSLPTGGNNRLVATLMACNEEAKRLRKVGVTTTPQKAPTPDAA